MIKLVLSYIVSLKVKVFKNLLIMSHEGLLYIKYIPFDYIAHQLEPI